MAQQQVSLKNYITNGNNNTITTQAYAVAPNGFNSSMISLGENGGSGVLNSSTATAVTSAPVTYGLVYVNSGYAYGVSNNSLHQYNIVVGASGYTYNTSWDLSSDNYSGTGFPLVNGTSIPTSSNNNNIFSQSLQIETGGTPITVEGAATFTVTNIFGTTSYLATDGINIYAMLPDSRIAVITMTSNAPSTISLITSVPVLQNLSNNASFGLAWLAGYLYTFDGSTNALTYVNINTGAFAQLTGTGIPNQYNGLAPTTQLGGGVTSYTFNGVDYLFITDYSGGSFYQINVAQLAASSKTSISFYSQNIYSFQERAISLAQLGNVLYLLSSNTPIATTYYNTYQLSISLVETPICFLKGTYIYTNEGYKQIETLKKGDLVNTFKDNYVAIDTIVEEEIYHDAEKPRNKSQLFKLDYPEYPQLLKELYVTGAHSILVGKLTDKQKERIIQDYGKVFATDLFDRLPAYIDERAKVHEESGTYTIYHLALENENMHSNYGIFANGLLVESLSKYDCNHHLW